MDLFLIKVISYVLLYFSVISLWLWDKRCSILIYIITICFAFYSDILTFYGVLLTIFIHMVCWVFYHHRCPKVGKEILGVIILILATGSCLHFLPGFHNLLLYKDIKFSTHSSPYSMYLNFDKAAIGFSMIYFRENLLTKYSHWKSMFAQLYRIIFLCILCVSCIALYFGYVSFEPKMSFIILVWAINNLLIVSVMEEVVFRGLIQQKISYILHQPILVILFSSLVFAATHYRDGINFIIYAFIAGLFYSYSFYRSGKIEAAIFTHFSLNLAHIILFTYPHTVVLNS